MHELYIGKSFIFLFIFTDALPSKYDDDHVRCHRLQRNVRNEQGPLWARQQCLYSTRVLEHGSIAVARWALSVVSARSCRGKYLVTTALVNTDLFVV
jgi:hypothetical protein